jgi:hypothetical protein
MKMEEIINATPHDVNIVDEEGKVIRTYPASGITVRLSAKTMPQGTLADGTPLYLTFFEKIEFIPEREEETLYIVPQLVKDAVGYYRGDFLVPADVVRDENGVVSCRALSF